jgi:hypothetical protein
MELTDKLGADAIIDFVNASKTVETDMQLLRRRASLVLVGLFGGERKLSLVSMPTRAYKIIGSYTGSISEMIELVSLAKRGVIKPVVSERFKLDQATEGLSKLKDGKITGRGVINPIQFNSEHKAMLGHCKMILENEGGRIAINQDRFDKLITSLRTAVDNDGVLDKESTSYNDIFDAFRLALKLYHFQERTD